MELEPGWEIVCPDGERRHHAYGNRGDAASDARSYDRRGCAAWRKGRRIPTSCPGGTHAVEPVVMAVPPPRGLS